MEKDCPVDFIQVNENRVRLTALWVFVLVSTSLFFVPLPIFLFLAVDFFLRAFNFGKYSPLNILSGVVVKQLKISNKPIDQAPKRFAAGIGFFLSLAIAILVLLQLDKPVLILSIVFIIFSFLESFLGICAGCHVYTLLQHARLIRK